MGEGILVKKTIAISILNQSLIFAPLATQSYLSIQRLSRIFLKAGLPLGSTLSIPHILISATEWPGRLKCRPTALSIFPWVMDPRCSAALSLKRRAVSPP